MASPALNKHTAVGFAIQNAFNTPNVSVTWAALRESTEFFDGVDTEEVLDQGDMSDYEYNIWSPGTYFQGTIAFSMLPGIMDDIANWITTRDSYNQPVYATLVGYDDKRGTPITIQDCVVSSATFTFAKKAPVSMSLSVFGRKVAASAPSAPDAADITTGIPYVCKEVAAYRDSNPDTTIEEFGITYDNSAEDPDEGFRLDGNGYPATMYTIAGPRAHGNLTRDYTDSTYRTIYDAQKNADLGDYSNRIAMSITCARGAASCEFTMPLVQFMTWSAPINGSSKGRRTERIDWRCLTDATGEDLPLEISVA